jgi:hypothetical protein
MRGIARPYRSGNGRSGLVAGSAVEQPGQVRSWQRPSATWKSFRLTPPVICGPSLRLPERREAVVDDAGRQT